MFKEGLVRFATQKYSNNPKHLEKRFIHLTNYSVNKKAEDYVKSGTNA
jgi:tubulin polyglutamylase TTLL4